MSTRSLAGVLGRLVGWLRSALVGKKKERRETPSRPVERVAHGPDERDARSFEQARRGGPLTGEAKMSEGPHHGGGGKRRGREDPEQAAALEAQEELDERKRRQAG